MRDEDEKEFSNKYDDPLSVAMKRRKKNIEASEPGSSIKYGVNGVDDSVDVNGNVVG